jgi:chemotaxis protein methyltransferase CheR
MSAPRQKDPEALEVQLLLDALYHRFGYDFRRYAPASLRRRVHQARVHLKCATISELQGRLLHEPEILDQLLGFLTVQVSEMFRDPAYYRALRERVLPHLATFPTVKVWVAGCSSGEELYSLAILFREEGLFDRTLFYATDINPHALAKAEAGIYPLDQIRLFTENHRGSGATGSLSDYYSAGYGVASFDPVLRSRVVFSDHSLATDEVFAEVHLISCRNVLIYFERALQDRALRLFRDALPHNGFLGLGSRESLRFSPESAAFEDFDRDNRIYRRRGP